MSALIWSPFANREQAAKAAASLLEERLIACANLVDGVQSMFLWQGRVDEATECGALFKTDGALLDQAIRRLEQLHPYDEPAIMGWHCDAAADATRAWLQGLTGAGSDGTD